MAIRHSRSGKVRQLKGPRNIAHRGATAIRESVSVILTNFVSCRLYFLDLDLTSYCKGHDSCFDFAPGGCLETFFEAAQSRYLQEERHESHQSTQVFVVDELHYYTGLFGRYLGTRRCSFLRKANPPTAT